MIRKTGLIDETHIALGWKFGELDDVTPYIKAGRKTAASMLSRLTLVTSRKTAL